MKIDKLKPILAQTLTIGILLEYAQDISILGKYNEKGIILFDTSVSLDIWFSSFNSRK